MRRVLAGLVLVLSSLMPALALAKGIEEVSFSADGNDVVITVRSDEALQAPTIRTMAGSVRVRFYDAKNAPTMHVAGDGGAVRAVDLTRGSDQSAAMMIVFSDHTHIAPADVRVERAADKTVLKIARGLLPALNDDALTSAAAKAHAVASASAATPAAAPAATPAAKPPVSAAAPAPVAKAASVIAAPVAAPVSKLAVVSPGASASNVAQATTPASADDSAPAAAASKPALTLGTKKSSPGRERELKMASGSSSALPMLLAISALLAISYGGLRLFMRKKTLTGEIPAIDVVAQRRLGPRHQLVIVRAFDRDYLLSIQGGQTTVVARSSRRKVEDVEARELARERSGDESLALFRGGVAHAAAMPKSAFEEEDDEVTFGGELFKQALEQRERAREQTASFRLEAARAEVRTGARERNDVEARAGARERNDVEAREPARGLSPAKGEHASANTPAPPPLPASEPSTGAMSDSVSGLLRLRREAGR